VLIVAPAARSSVRGVSAWSELRVAWTSNAPWSYRSLPDTGTLRGDLELAAVRFVEAIAPLGAIMMRAAALAVPTDEAPVALPTRADQLQAMLDRAAARGEKAPTLTELLEGITAPLYLHPLFFGRPADAGHARELVRRLLVYVEADQRSL